MNTPKNVSAYDIGKELRKKHENQGDIYFSEVKNGRTAEAKKGEMLRLDGWSMKKSYENPVYTGYEIKVSRGDFVRDNKWHKYLDYCHRFYFVCPRGLISPKEITDPNTGLIYYNPDSPVKKLRTVKTPHSRNVEVPASFYKYLLFSKINELSEEKKPRAEARLSSAQAIYAYVKDGNKTISFSEISWRLSHKMRQKVEDLARREESMRRQDESLKEIIRPEEIAKIMQEYFPDDMPMWWRRSSKQEKLVQLREFFKAERDMKMPRTINLSVKTALDAIQRLDKCLNKEIELTSNTSQLKVENNV